MNTIFNKNKHIAMGPLNTNLLLIFGLLVALSGCGKLPTLPNELRITEYGADIEGDNVATPVEGKGVIGGVRISLNGSLPDDMQVYYKGKQVIICKKCTDAAGIKTPLWAQLTEDRQTN